MASPLGLPCASDKRPVGTSLAFIRKRVSLIGLDVEIVHIRNLRFPFPIRIEVETGICDVSIQGFMRTLRHGDYRVLPALQEISLTLRSQVKLVLTLAPAPPPGSDSIDSGESHGAVNLSIDAVRKRKPVTAGIASAVFAAPQADWRLSSAAALLGNLNCAELSRKLLQECESFRQVVRTQRLSRFVFDLLTSAPELACAHYGFSDRCHLENAVYDQFGISVQSFARLSPITQSRSGISAPNWSTG